MSMKLHLDAKNPRLALDEDGNVLLEFKGLHLSDWREIIAKVNDYYKMGFSTREVPI